jgi:hypothetical protein
MIDLLGVSLLAPAVAAAAHFVYRYFDKSDKIGHSDFFKLANDLSSAAFHLNKQKELKKLRSGTELGLYDSEETSYKEFISAKINKENWKSE